jgi:hypothetical protein
MSLITQPGSDYQLGQLTLDAGHAHDIMLMLLDVHSVLDHLYLDGTTPQITAPAEDYLRESASPYTLPALIDALAEVINMLSRAIRDAGPPADPAAGHTPSGPGGARSKENHRPRTTPGGARSEEADSSHRRNTVTDVRGW